MDTLEAWTKISLGDHGAKYMHMTFLNCALPFPGQGQFVGLASNVSMNGPDRTWPRWPAFFDSELCNMDCGDEFGMELTAEELVQLACFQ